MSNLALLISARGSLRSHAIMQSNEVSCVCCGHRLWFSIVSNMGKLLIHVKRIERVITRAKQTKTVNDEIVSAIMYFAYELRNDDCASDESRAHGLWVEASGVRAIQIILPNGNVRVQVRRYDTAAGAKRRPKAWHCSQQNVKSIYKLNCFDLGIVTRAHIRHDKAFRCRFSIEMWNRIKFSTVFHT